MTLGFGGDAANAAVMAARIGVTARFAGRVGDDALGRRLVSFWERVGVDVLHVRADPDGPTGIYVNQPGAAGLHRFDYHRRCSAGSRLARGDVGDPFLDALDILHLTGITLAVSESSRDAALDLAERAKARGARISLAVNHRPALGGDVERLRAAASSADIVLVSDEEAATVFGTADALELASLTASEELVVTRGDRGAVVVAAGATHEVDALPIDPVDPAGAGDALAGAYLAARLQGLPPARAASPRGRGRRTLVPCPGVCALVSRPSRGRRCRRRGMIAPCTYPGEHPLDAEAS